LLIQKTKSIMIVTTCKTMRGLFLAILLMAVSVKCSPEDFVVQLKSMNIQATEFLDKLKRTNQVLNGPLEMQIKQQVGALESTLKDILKTRKLNVNEAYDKGLNFYRRQSYRESFGLFKQASDEGHMDATVHVGFMYQTGQGVVKNIPKALEYFTKADAGGNSRARPLLDALQSQLPRGRIPPPNNPVKREHEDTESQRAAKRQKSTPDSSIVKIEPRD